MRKSVFPPAASANSPGWPSAQRHGNAAGASSPRISVTVCPLMKACGSSPNRRVPPALSPRNATPSCATGSPQAKTCAKRWPVWPLRKRYCSSTPARSAASCRKVFCWLRIFSRQNGKSLAPSSEPWPIRPFSSP